MTFWEDEDLFYVFGPKDELPPARPKSAAPKKSNAKGRSASPSKRGGGRGDQKKEPATGQVVIDRLLKRDPPGEKPLVRLLPLVDTLRAKRYTYVDALFCWDMVLHTEEIVGLVSQIPTIC